VEQEVRSRALKPERLSRLTGPLGGDCDVLLIDTLGQLGRMYKLGAAAFVGGSLVPVGGHNVLEPAALGVPVLFGPHTDHFAEPAGELERAGGGLRVSDAAALGRAVAGLLSDRSLRRRTAAAAEKVVAGNRGALERTVDLVFNVLGERGRASGGQP
jgi:3-deoxy-D-manno-octulosonic-acid transferase